jgi:hypothetical protein
MAITNQKRRKYDEEKDYWDGEFKRNGKNIKTRRGESAEKIVGKGKLFTWKNRKKSERR